MLTIIIILDLSVLQTCPRTSALPAVKHNANKIDSFALYLHHGFGIFCFLSSFSGNSISQFCASLSHGLAF